MGSTYRTELAKLTEEVITNGRLLRIRTNEGPGGFWKLTEFEHDGTTKLLRRSTIKQSPTEALHSAEFDHPGQLDQRQQSGSARSNPGPAPIAPIRSPSYMMPNTFCRHLVARIVQRQPQQHEPGILERDQT